MPRRAKRSAPTVRNPSLRHPPLDRQRHDGLERTKRTYVIRTDYVEKVDQLVAADVYLNRNDVVETALKFLINHHWPNQA